MSHPEQHLLTLARAFGAYARRAFYAEQTTELNHGKAYIVILVKFYLATRHKVVKN